MFTFDVARVCITNKRRSATSQSQNPPMHVCVNKCTEHRVPLIDKQPVYFKGRTCNKHELSIIDKCVYILECLPYNNYHSHYHYYYLSVSNSSYCTLTLSHEL